MKKKIEYLTLDEVSKICKKHSCDDCPLWNLRNEDVCLFDTLEEWLGFMNKDEVELEK